MQQLEYRLEIQQRIVHLVYTALLALRALAWLATGSFGVGILFLLLTGLGAAQFFWTGTFGMDATPQGILLRGYTKRQFAWNQVARIYGGNYMLGQRRTYVQLTDGRTIRAWAPMNYWSMPDGQFDQKVATLQQWHAHYSAGQGAAPQPAIPQQYAAPQQAAGQQYGAPQQSYPQGQPAQQYAQPYALGQPYGQAQPQQPYAQQPDPYAQQQYGRQPQSSPPQQPSQQPAQQSPAPAQEQPPASEWTMMFGAEEQQQNPPSR